MIIIGSIIREILCEHLNFQYFLHLVISKIAGYCYSVNGYFFMLIIHSIPQEIQRGQLNFHFILHRVIFKKAQY